jgi:hypothetical protein
LSNTFSGTGFWYPRRHSAKTLPPEATNELLLLITKYHATYFCGHEHIPNVQKLADPTKANKGTAYQVIVGSGGSPFDDKLTGTCPSCAEPVLTNPYDRYYAWALVQVHKSGAVSLNLYGCSNELSPALLFFDRQVVGIQPSGESLTFCRRVNIWPNDVARRQCYPSMTQQWCQPAPVQPVAIRSLQSDGHHRITVMRVLLDLVSDHGEQQAVVAWRGQLQYTVATGIQHTQNIRQRGR